MAAALTQINGYAHVAARYGFEEAVFLHSLMFWYRTNRANDRNFRDGRWWTYNTIRAFEDIFPWWSAKQIRRIADSCREQGALVTGNYNQDRRDRTVWYSPGDELLALYGLDAETGDCNCPNGQMQLPEQAGEDAQTGKCNIRKPCSNHGETDNTPYSPPEGDAPPGENGTVDKPAAAGKAQPVQGADKPVEKSIRRRSFIPPDVEQVRAYCRERGNGIDPEAFVDYYTSKGWVVGRTPMRDWKAAVRTWEQRRRSQRKEGDIEDDWYQ